MKENKLIIRIQRPVSEVFDFTINPSNTPCWIDSIREERTDSKEIKVGTQYTNVSTDGLINSYRVTRFADNEIFELKSLLPGYHVRYTYRAISENETEMEYYEWDEVAIANPFQQSVLEKLKRVLETDK